MPFVVSLLKLFEKILSIRVLGVFVIRVGLSICGWSAYVLYKEDVLVFDHGSVWLKANLC